MIIVKVIEVAVKVKVIKKIKIEKINLIKIEKIKIIIKVEAEVKVNNKFNKLT